MQILISLAAALSLGLCFASYAVGAYYLLRGLLAILELVLGEEVEVNK